MGTNASLDVEIVMVAPSVYMIKTDIHVENRAVVVVPSVNMVTPDRLVGSVVVPVFVCTKMSSPIASNAVDRRCVWNMVY